MAPRSAMTDFPDACGRTRAATMALYRQLVVTLVVLIALAGFALVIRWDMSRECVRWATRVDSTGGATYQTSVCAEYRPKGR